MACTSCGTAASAWLTAGVDIAAVAAWLGDKVKTVCETYAHMMPGADEGGRRAMDEFFTQLGSALNVPSEGSSDAAMQLSTLPDYFRWK